ncbi:hypothetical protein [Mycobacterium sp.]|uniref:hypothetical protein n=1 Tax=Mycobacterium sp. TaxID=1785 RepID=UPI003BAA8D63
MDTGVLDLAANTSAVGADEHARPETLGIPSEIEVGRYRRAYREGWLILMSAETVGTDKDAGAAAAVALVRQRAPETRFLPLAARLVPDHPGYFQVNRVDRAGRVLPNGWTFLANMTKRAVVRTSGDPDRLDFTTALRRGVRE